MKGTDTIRFEVRGADLTAFHAMAEWRLQNLLGDDAEVPDYVMDITPSPTAGGWCAQVTATIYGYA